MPQTSYDYIIAGAGCAGLSLAMHLVQQKALQQKKILLIDEAPKNRNDRTWCFWETGESLFEPIVFRHWKQLYFNSPGFSSKLTIAPYCYKMIRGIDFYRHCFAELEKHSNLTVMFDKVESVFSAAQTGVVAGGRTFTADYVFNSIPPPQPATTKGEIWFLQHFKGWLIETEEDAFTPDAATLMDFRISQKAGTAFCYVLPFSSKEALVEYTLFTPSLLKPEEYDKGLKTYTDEKLSLKNYRIKETEFGVIPMTNHRFSTGERNIINIGTAGGQTKGSSGYTFYFIQQHCKAITNRLLRGQHPLIATTPWRFHFYDSVLLGVLEAAQLPGHQIFSTLFRKNKPSDVLAFLNNASNLPTELRIISSLPTWPFMQAAIRQLS
jgi:lycopene beta-cyclase